MKKFINWRNHLNIYLLTILIINILLLGFPLTSVFGYEFAVINSMILVLLSGFYTVYYFKRDPGKSDKEFLRELLKSLSFFLIVPFLVSIINSIITGFCSFCDGIQFYIVITAPSIIIGAALGMVSILMLKQFRAGLIILLYIMILSIIGFELYFNPQVYFYNPILGYFPGTIYDEAIAVDLKLVMYRLANLLFFGGILLLAVKMIYNSIKHSKIILILLSLVVSLVFYFLSPGFGYSTTFNSLSDNLEKELVSEHFIIHYDNKISTGKIKILALKQEYYFEVLRKYFNSAPSEKINSFIFNDDDQKKKLFGSKNADVAKPWLNQIYVSIENLEHTLKHEIAHCFTANFGAGIFKLAAGFNPMLIEGIASAADGFYQENSIHYMAGLAYNNNYQVNLENLLTKFGFYNQPSSLSYIYAGSFVNFLVDEKGIDTFKTFYRTGDFEKSYGIELKPFLKGYYNFLSFSSGTGNQYQADYYFGRKSLFQKLCPRAISLRLRNGWEHYSNGDYMGAQIIFLGIYSSGENYSALVGLVESYKKLNRLNKSVKTLEKAIDSFEGTSYYFNLELLFADLLAVKREFGNADSLYNILSEQNPNRRLFYIANTRLELMKNNRLIVKYLKGNNFDKYKIIRKLNSGSYKYSTFPVWIYLSKSYNEDYDIFMEQFNKKIIVDDYLSSYAAYSLSKYMLDNYDFINARKMAALSLRYNADKNFTSVLKSQYQMTGWFYTNGNKILSEIKYEK